MNRITFLVPRIFFAGLILAASSCMRDGEVLAEYQGGNVIRKDLRFLFQLMGRADEPRLEDQIQVVRELALTRITAKEAVAAGLDKDPKTAKELALHEERTALTALDYMLRTSGKHKFRMVEMQALQLSSRGEDVTKRKAEADEMLAKLNSGMSDSDIEKFISDKTENGRYRFFAGYLDPHCISCNPNPLDFLTNLVEKAENRKFVVVETPQGYWIVRRIALHDVKADDLKDVFEDYHRKAARIARARIATMTGPEKDQAAKELIMDEKKIDEISTWQAREQTRREYGNLLNARSEAEKEAKKFAFHPAARPREKPKAEDYKDDTPLFSINGKDYTYGMLKARILKEVPDAPLELQLEAMHAVIIPYELLKDTSDIEKAKKHDVYEYVSQLRKDQVYANAYFAKNRPEDGVSEAEIAQEYDVRKNTEFKDQSLGQVHDRIAQQIKMTRMQKKSNEIRKALTEKYGLKVLSDKLKPGKI